MAIRPSGRFLLIVTLACAGLKARAADHFPWSTIASRPEGWYRSPEGLETIANVLSHQAELGGWPKNVDTSAARFEGDRASIKGTFDNGATTGEVRFLAKAFRATGDERCRSAVEKAIDHILTAQYSNGGLPQFHPPGRSYHRYITFNDDTMVKLLELMRDVARSSDFDFLDQARRDSARSAFDKGIRCIVRCQVKVNGRPTVWCAQHDEKTLEPRGGRTFELVSLSGSESAGILILLMSLDRPDAEVERAIEAGVKWFEGAGLTGIKLDRSSGDLKVVHDADAPTLWPRFVEIETGRAIFASRDGIARYDISEIDAERRNGYAWYGTWGRKVAERYKQWKRRAPSSSKS
jgi:PelA/Pel-15E family pectate lyase